MSLQPSETDKQLINYDSPTIIVSHMKNQGRVVWKPVILRAFGPTPQGGKEVIKLTPAGFA